MSISVIGFPLGSYKGLASTSILELFTAGKDDPGFTGVSLPETSALTAGDPFCTGTWSVAIVLDTADLGAIVREGALWNSSVGLLDGT